MKPELLADYACQVGENPLWHPMEKRVYWTDILKARIYYYEPATKKHGIHFEGKIVGGFTIQSDGALLLFMDDGAVATLRKGKLDYILTSIPGEEQHRFNDVSADPEGRVL
ncbi:MAG: SMP-30/gluconolactonase/LRE family protein, partial [SAR202 cluster bacterium]|nr:SMP-30/gluconolactonase/LRE family protein [SAR202 cluster bacterium]